MKAFIPPFACLLPLAFLAHLDAQDGGGGLEDCGQEVCCLECLCCGPGTVWDSRGFCVLDDINAKPEPCAPQSDVCIDAPRCVGADCCAPGTMPATDWVRKPLTSGEGDACMCIPDQCESGENGTVCGTASPTECEKEVVFLIQKMAELNGELEYVNETAAAEGPDRMLFEGEGDDDFSRRKLQRTSETYMIRTYFHVIRSSRDQGDMDNSLSKRFQDVLNKAYENTPFRFNFRPVNKVTNANWAVATPWNLRVIKPTLRRKEKKELNVFFLDTRLLGYLGLATFPHEAINSPSQDGVVMMNPQIYTAADAAIAGTTLEALTHDSIWTLVHEVGHWLGLYHTFESLSCVDNEGYTDGVADTATQKCPSWDKDGWQTCFQDRAPPQGTGNGGFIDTCSSLQGVDDVQNYMNYIHSSCMENHGHFTPGQVQRMIIMHEFYRLNNKAIIGTSRRRLQTGIVDPETLLICGSSMLLECNCDGACMELLLRLLSNLGRDLFFLMRDIFDVCNRCTNIDGNDENCATDEFCAPAEWWTISPPQFGDFCVKKYELNEECRTDAMCRSGFCAGGRCKLGSNAACLSSSDCSSGLCSGGICVGSPNAMACTANSQCHSNLCGRDNTCLPCPDTACSDGLTCSATGSCMRKGFLGDDCTSSTDCFTSFCDKGKCVECLPSASNSTCGFTEFCSSTGKCIQCLQQSDCLEIEYCEMATQRCQLKKISTLGCHHDYECNSDACFYDEVGDGGGRCAGRKCLSDDECIGGNCLHGHCVVAAGARCDADQECLTQQCGADGLCVGLPVGAACLKNDWCASLNCDSVLGTCQPCSAASCDLQVCDLVKGTCSACIEASTCNDPALRGADYRGCVAVTETGKECQRWDRLALQVYFSPDVKEYTPDDYPDDGLVENYCRNPGGEKSRPWCYTQDLTAPVEYCDIPGCESAFDPPTAAPLTGGGGVPVSMEIRRFNAGFGNDFTAIFLDQKSTDTGAEIKVAANLLDSSFPTSYTLWEAVGGVSFDTTTIFVYTNQITDTQTLENSFAMKPDASLGAIFENFFFLLAYPEEFKDRACPLFCLQGVGFICICGESRPGAPDQIEGRT